MVRNLAWCGVVVLLVSACGQKAEPAPVSTRVENEALGVAVAAVPTGAEVVNQGEDFEVAVPHEGGDPTRCKIAVGPEVRGVNLVEEVGIHKAQFEALEGGEVAGTTELGGPLGPAYLVRGRYLLEGVPLEEMRVLTLHPTASKTLVLHCVYPRRDDEDSKARFAGVVGLLAELEAPTPAA